MSKNILHIVLDLVKAMREGHAGLCRQRGVQVYALSSREWCQLGLRVTLQSNFFVSHV